MSVGRAFNSERESASRKRWREIDKVASRVLSLTRGELVALCGEDGQQSKEQLIADLLKEFDRLMHEEAEAFPEEARGLCRRAQRYPQQCASVSRPIRGYGPPSLMGTQ